MVKEKPEKVVARVTARDRVKIELCCISKGANESRMSVLAFSPPSATIPPLAPSR